MNCKLCGLSQAKPGDAAIREQCLRGYGFASYDADCYERALTAARERIATLEAPIPMLLYCPMCGAQHVDAPEPEQGWTNPPHKSHLCHSCKTVWRPADVATTGVERIATRGERDTFDPKPQVADGLAFAVVKRLNAMARESNADALEAALGREAALLEASDELDRLKERLEETCASLADEARGAPGGPDDPYHEARAGGLLDAACAVRDVIRAPRGGTS